MARITQDDFSGQSDAKDNNIVEIDATAHETITVPNADFISQSDISRDGQDLVLESPQGQTIVVQNYFTMDDAPLIEAPDGSILTSNLVNSFLNSSPEYAQVGSLNDVSPIGAVEEITGEATVIRVDGSTETLSLGSPIYKGDTIETNGDGAVNISFIDETSMAVSENARLSVDEYQFDPATESGETNLSVLRGVFVFTSGLIGRDDPDDVNIDTPVGSIGIRGTVIAGNINPGGESKITVVEGAIVVTNGVSETTLSQQYESVRLGGFNENMQDIGVQDAATVSKTYGSVSDVVPKLFSSINDNIKQEANEAQSNENAEEQSDETLDASEEVIEQEEVIETEEAQPENTVNEVIDLNLTGNDVLPADVKGQKDNQLKEEMRGDKPFNGLRNKGIEDLQINPELLGDRPLKVTGGFKLFEGKNEGDAVAKFVATGGSQGFVNFTFEDGSTTSANSLFEIVRIDSRRVEVQLTNAGESSLNGTAAGTAISSPFLIIATDSAGNQQSFNFAPVVLDSAVHLNSAGGITDFLVRDGINLGPEKIGDFNGNKLEDTINIATSNLDILSGINGTSLFGAAVPDLTNANIAGVGDINNDGFADFIYGDPEYDVFADADQGILRLVLGADSAPAPTNVFTGANIDDQVGTAVAGIGDFDGDGKADYAFSAPGDDTAGTDRGSIHFNLTGGNSTILNGHVDGMKLGNNITGLGDINGDGYSDVMFSATNPIDVDPSASVDLRFEAYILKGSNVTLPPNTDGMTKISPHHEIVGGGTAGDMNGDGFDDIAISLYDSTLNQVNTFVIFGSNGLPSLIDMNYLENPDNAIKIKHSNIGAGTEYNVVDLGDVNGDGFDDIQLGVVGGQEYIVHGKASDDVIFDNKDNTIAGTGDGDSNLGKIQATDSNQSLVGDAHFIDNAYTGLSMRGGDGRNDFSLQSTNFRKIDGGAGVEDTIRYGMTSGSGTLNFTNINFEQIEQIERIHFTKSNDTIRLTAENIFNMLKTSDNGSLTIELDQNPGATASNATLEIDAISQSTVVSALNELGSGASQEPDKTFNGNTYNHYEIGGYDLYIDTDVTTTVV